MRRSNGEAGRDAAVVRRARPALGTLVEIGAASAGGSADAAIEAAFARIAAVESRLSRFLPGSDIERFNTGPAGAEITISADTRRVLAAARRLRDDSGDAFDISLGSGPRAWRCDGAVLHKLSAGVALDLGGIGKGHAVDRGVAALRAAGVPAGWINAGGDLRVFGALAVPVDLRDERGGGVHRFATLSRGAFATSLLGGRQVSVAAGRCLWADALTKLVAESGDAWHPLLGRFAARAWLH